MGIRLVGPLIALALSMTVTGCSNSVVPDNQASSSVIPQVSPTPIFSSSPAPQTSESTEQNSAQKTSTPMTKKKSPVPKKVIETSIAKKSPLPTSYEIGRAYQWEDDPSRFGLAYTKLQPVETGISWAIFKPKPDQVLLVYAWGPYRAGDLYIGVNGFEVVDATQTSGTPTWYFYLTCDTGEKKLAQLMGKTWSVDEHPESFTYSPLEESNPCLKQS
jgi:hypothetical protein